MWGSDFNWKQEYSKIWQEPVGQTKWKQKHANGASKQSQWPVEFEGWSIGCTRLKDYYRIVKEKLNLVKSLDKEIINVCEVDHIKHERQESKEINLRVRLMIQYIKEATSLKVNIKGNSILTSTNANVYEQAISTSILLTTGPQSSMIFANVDSVGDPTLTCWGFFFYHTKGQIRGYSCMSTANLLAVQLQNFVEAIQRCSFI